MLRAGGTAYSGRMPERRTSRPLTAAALVRAQAVLESFDPAPDGSQVPSQVAMSPDRLAAELDRIAAAKAN